MRKPSTTLTEGEQRLLEVLWTRGPSSVADVLEALPSTDRPAFTTVQTMLRLMETKGYLRHEAAGRTFTYHPLVDRMDAERAAVRSVLARFFDGSAERLTLRLLEDDGLSPDELARLKRLIARAPKS